MNELDQTLARVRAEKKKALIFYLAAGYPKFSEQLKLIKEMVAAGINVLELGIPFSDPIADGPTIQFASQESLNNGTTLEKVLQFTKALKRQVSIPIVYMSYLNPILAYGMKRFAAKARAVGVSGLIVPDLIPEEADELKEILTAHNIHLISMVAPTTPMARQKSVANQTQGFLYVVSVAGVTGARRSYSAETKKWLNGLRGISRKPVCVGFGISGPEQVRQLRKSVDGFIVGSALIDQIRQNPVAKRRAAIRKFTERLAKECRHAS